MGDAASVPAIRRSCRFVAAAGADAANQIQAQLDIAEEAAGRVKALMVEATSQWEHVRARATAECERLQRISNDLQDRFAWRVMLQFAAFFLLVSGISLLAGHYLWKH